MIGARADRRVEPRHPHRRSALREHTRPTICTFIIVKGTKRITACRECETFWDEAAPPECLDEGHAKSQHDLHVHQDTVTFADGASVVAASHDDRYERDQEPEFGLYLDARWSPPWPHDHVDWPDFGLPGDAVEFRRQLRDLLDRAQRGERVEVGCLGGHGRTGTALACAAILTGHDAEEAVDWVRDVYCQSAVETEEQRAFVAAFSADI